MSQRKQLSAAEKRDLLKEGLTPDEIKHLEIQLDPVIWAETFLRDPERPSKPLKVRFYQKEMLRCEARKKVYRCGRRIGKSIVLCIEMLWKAFCNEGKRILVCAPYKNQVQLLWKDGFNKLIRGNKFIEASISNMTQNPFAIYFKNGSRISGLTAGSKTGNKGTSIRGQNADDLYLDEVDYMGDEAIHSIMAIIATKEFGRFIISSTPTGRREFFYDACTNKYLGYHQFHYPSSASPEWVSIEDARRRNLPLHESQEYLFRNQCPEHVYQHEYDAEFGEEAQGVFKHKFIGSSLVLYDPEKEEIDPKGKYWFCGEAQRPENIYTLGVDWNGDKVGTQLVITEYCRIPTDMAFRKDRSDVAGSPDAYDMVKAKVEKKYRMYYRESVSIKDMTQTESIKRIIELNQRFKIDHIYVDAGFGTTNIEELRLYGMKFRESGILDKLKAIDFASTILVYDPYTKEQVKKAIKPFMVYNTQTCLERDELILPEAEDEKVKLIGQMREYRIEKFSPQGVPQFSRENDHILDAFMLSLLAYQMEYSELVQVQYSNQVTISKKPSLLVPGLNEVKDRHIHDKRNDQLEKHGIPKRGPMLDADRYLQKSPKVTGSHVDYEDVIKTKDTKSPFSTAISKTGWSKIGSPTRSNF